MTPTPATLAAVVDLLERHIPGLVGAYRYGSWGTQHFRSDSDVDLAVLPGAPLDSAELWRLAQQLAALLGRDVDLVDLLGAPTVLQAQVVHGGERFHAVDELACERFEDRVFSAYALLNEERRGILDEIAARGTVYAERDPAGQGRRHRAHAEPGAAGVRGPRA